MTFSRVARDLAMFAGGRHARTAVAAYAVGMLAACTGWYLSLPTHLLGQFHARWLLAWEVVPLLMAVVICVLLAPLHHLAETLATATVRPWYLLSGSAVVVLVGVVPVAAYGILERLPDAVVPNPGGSYIAQVSTFAQTVKPWQAQSISLTATTAAGVALALTALLGPRLGPLAVVGVFAGVVALQSSPVTAGLVPLIGTAGQPMQPPGVSGIALALAAAAAGIITWTRTCGMSRLGHRLSRPRLAS